MGQWHGECLSVQRGRLVANGNTFILQGRDMDPIEPATACGIAVSPQTGNVVTTTILLQGNTFSSGGW